YDHQCVTKPKGTAATYVLEYDECRSLIDSMRFTADSTLFGNEKDDSFKGSIGAIYQSFGGQEVYSSLQEKAANLLYFVVKNHSFSDGNKRIAAAMFLYFLDKNNALFRNGSKRIDDSTLVAITIMIAESRPEEKEIMISLIMNFLQ
ncbi:MAG: Fic family protein, partial [Oscillospiraceae bacterium]|nr:Fic family protein [Oscillospiraceae bacterium]